MEQTILDISPKQSTCIYIICNVVYVVVCCR